PSMVRTRNRAAASLLADKPTVDVDRVLDFFEFVSFLADRNAIEAETAWHEFYWPMVNYWLSAKPYIDEIRRRRTEHQTWQDPSAVLWRLVEVEATDGGPSDEDRQQFLLDESHVTP